MKKYCRFFLLLFAIVFISFSSNKTMAQGENRYMRIAKIIVDSAQLENYKAALKEGMAAAVSKEPGVISLNAFYDKEHPTHVTVFEIYASVDAYKLHTQAPHFLKYKAAVKDMVKSLELTDVVPILLESKNTK